MRPDIRDADDDTSHIDRAIDALNNPEPEEPQMQTTRNPQRFAILALIALAMFLAGVLVGRQAHAQTAGRSATISFTAPTTYTDGSSIASGTTISYNVYQGAQGSTSKTKVSTITGTSTTISTGLQAGTQYCWQVTAVINGVESAQSNEGCKSFPFPTPSTITITVT